MNTNTKEINLPAHAEIETTPCDWQDSVNLVTSFRNSPDFLRELAAEGIEDELTSMEYAAELSIFTQQYLKQADKLFSEDSAAQILLVANTPYTVHAAGIISQYAERRSSSERLTNEEFAYFKQLKKFAVEHNQMLNGYLYDHPKESYANINEALTAPTLDHFPKHAHHAAAITTQILRGARTEAATRHLLETAQVPHRPANVQEDLSGADIVIIVGESEIPVDIKSSLDQLAASAGGYDELGQSLFLLDRNEKYNSTKILFFPAFTDQELGDSVRLNPETELQRSSIVATELQKAVIAYSR